MWECYSDTLFPSSFQRDKIAVTKKSFNLERQNHLLSILVSSASHVVASCVLELSCCKYLYRLSAFINQ